jgi:hypothetical protein
MPFVTLFQSHFPLPFQALLHNLCRTAVGRSQVFSIPGLADLLAHLARDIALRFFFAGSDSASGAVAAYSYSTGMTGFNSTMSINGKGGGLGGSFGGTQSLELTAAAEGLQSAVLSLLLSLAPLIHTANSDVMKASITAATATAADATSATNATVSSSTATGVASGLAGSLPGSLSWQSLYPVKWFHDEAQPSPSTGAGSGSSGSSGSNVLSALEDDEDDDEEDSKRGDKSNQKSAAVTADEGSITAKILATVLLSAAFSSDLIAIDKVSKGNVDKRCRQRYNLSYDHNV